MNTKKNKINLDELIKDYTVKNISAFNSYLKQVWTDLSKRSEKDKEGVDRINFEKYYELPGIISERLFSVFDSRNEGFLQIEDFTNNMIKLFSGDYDTLINFIFDFYDFDKDGKISKEDVRIVLSYVPVYKKLQQNQGLKFEKDNFQDRLDSQQELHEKLDTLFKTNKYLTLNEFKYLTQNINSNIFLYILVFLMEHRPFNNETIKNLDNIKKNTVNILPKRGNHFIALPDTNSKLIVSRTISSKSPTIKHNKNKNILKKNITAYGVLQNKNKTIIQKENINNNNYINNKKKIINNNNYINNLLISPDSDDESIHTNGTIQKKPSRKTSKNISLMDVDTDNEIKYIDENDNSLLDYARPYDINTMTINNEENNPKNFNETINKNINETNNNTNNENIDKQNDVITEGYIFKIQANKVKKIYFRLICKDLYYYKSKENKRHKGIHNLSGVFIKDDGLVKLGDKKYFCFTIIFPTKPRKYYLSNEAEYKNWVNSIRKIVGYSNLNDIYEIKQILGKGKFGLVKLGIHRQTKRKVAIKIINKKLICAIDVQQVKTEIDILKIAKHPNIIQLYDVFENENYIYIIMEYCAGGDLFSYIEKRGFRLPETRAAEIIHKLSTAVFFLHEYGIVHRDLKPENILMTDNSNNADIRLVDFGLGKIIGPGVMCHDPFGTFSYVAPEVLQEKPYSFKVDLFAIGIIAYLLVAGFLPFDHETSEREIAKQTVYEPTPFPACVWNNISIEARMFVDNLLNKNPDKRMGIQEVLQHKWLQKFNAKEMVSFKRRTDRQLSGAQKFEVFSTLTKTK